jgi:methyl-accepting chemotaxis protein
MKEKNQRKIKNYLINKKLQLPIVTNSIICLAIASIIIVLVVLHPFIFDMMFSKDPEIQHEAAESLSIIVKRLIPTVIVLFVLFISQMIIVTHKISGPLENFRQTFEQITRGNFTRRVIIRRGDYLADECRQINEMINGLSNMVKRLIEDNKTLMTTLEGLKHRSGDLDTEEGIKSALDILKQEARYIEKTLNLFKI